MVAGAEQGVGLGFGQVGDDVPLGSLGRDGQHTLDRRRVLGMPESDVGEQRVDRRQAVVAGGWVVAAVAFEVVQERADQRRVEVCDVERHGRLRGAL